MSVVVPTRFRLRRDTAANWSSVNPVLLEGEPALELDTGKVKYGDGVTAWTSLPYSSGGANASGVSFTPAGNVAATNVQAAIQELDTEKAALASPTFTGTLTLNHGPSSGIFGQVSGVGNWALLGATGQVSFYADNFLLRSYAGTLRATFDTNGLDVEGEVRGDSLRIDATPTAAAVAQTHHVPISINGVTYKLLLAS